MAASFIERNGTMLQIGAGLLFAILTVALSWYFGTRNRMAKTIDYQVLSNVAVLTNTSARPERLKILFDDTEARDPFITQIRIENTGKQVIEPEDFLTCIQICRDNCTILEWGVVEESADGVSGYMGMTSFPGECERIDTTPGTMNPSDWFIVQIVWDGDRKEPLRVTSRMRGEKRPMRKLAPREPSVMFINMAGVFGAIGLPLALIFATILLLDRQNTVGFPVLLSMSTVGSIAAAYLAYVTFVYKRSPVSSPTSSRDD